MRTLTDLEDGIGHIQQLDADVDTEEVVAIETRPEQAAVGC